ncbi:hypothetical protein AHF37_08245, partial [Paragonimus kellicotti]
LTKLNLRYCNLGPNEAKHIATRLGSVTSANSRLLSLDLSGNQLKDEGAIYLAQGNLFDETCEQMQHFNETMSARDPLNKQATMSDGDMGSVDVLDNG